ncbi:hypothetical protein FACS189421_02890 [Bacteroidia bacterium]|nr:hypothetical protein FACS189421_02890 [Bacteroidia bacterium]
MRKPKFLVTNSYRLNGKSFLEPLSPKNDLFRVVKGTRFVAVDSDYVGNPRPAVKNAKHSAVLAARARSGQGKKENKINGKIALFDEIGIVKINFVADYEIHDGILDNLSFVSEITRRQTRKDIKASKTDSKESTVNGKLFDQTALTLLIDAMEKINQPSRVSRAEIEILGNDYWHKADLSIDLVSNPDQFILNALFQRGKQQAKVKGVIPERNDLEMHRCALVQFAAELKKVSQL